jgi:hypothetical protein
MFTDVGVCYAPDAVLRGEGDEFDGAEAVGRLERCLVENHGYQAHAVRGDGAGREGVLAHVRRVPLRSSSTAGASRGRWAPSLASATNRRRGARRRRRGEPAYADEA